MKPRPREDERRPSASAKAASVAERERLRAMTSIERMTAALRAGRRLRALGRERPARE